MNSNGIIHINDDELVGKIKLLKLERQKMYEALYGIKNDSLGIEYYWVGDTGEEVRDSLLKHVSKYDALIIKLDNYIKYLEAVVSAYREMDSMINKAVDEKENGLVF